LARCNLLALRVLWLMGLAAVGTATRAAPANSQFQVDVGLGHEVQSAPLFQITRDSNIFYQDGLQSLSGSHVRTSLQGSADWTWEQGISTSVAVNATIKRAPGATDLDFSSVALQPAVRMPWGAASMGLGVSLQRFDVGGHHFRDESGWQLDWTQSDASGLWALIGSASAYHHVADWADMDAQSTSLVLLRQIGEPLPGVEGLDLSLILGQETNDHGLLELSSRSAMFHSAAHWPAWGADWTLGLGWREDAFEGTAFVAEPVRQDRTHMADIAAQWPLSAARSVRLEYNQVRNASSTHLYDNLYQQLSVTLRTVW
jgi:hypothetical protein